MQFKEDAIVRTSEGDKVGTIDRVVIDPITMKAIYLVVRHGLLFQTDKVVPVDWVGSTTQDEVILAKTDIEPDELVDFEETHFIEVEDPRDLVPGDPGFAKPSVWYPPVVGTWPSYGLDPASQAQTGFPWPFYVVEKERQVPEETVSLKEGADVYDVHAQHIGQVERVFVDPRSEIATHFLISKGILLKTKTLVPTSWVRSLDENMVHMGVPAKLLERLPEYDGEILS